MQHTQTETNKKPEAPPLGPADAGAVATRTKQLLSQAWDQGRATAGKPCVFRKGSEFVSVHVDGSVLLSTGEEIASWQGPRN